MSGAGKQQFYKRIGDSTTEAGCTPSEERSTLTFARRIERRLLIGQGANDTLINARESDWTVAAMIAKEILATNVMFPDEGHGFAGPANNIACNAVAENTV